jgi:PelA/Pel-15E family pectate lyase
MQATKTLSLSLLLCVSSFIATPAISRAEDTPSPAATIAAPAGERTSNGERYIIGTTLVTATVLPHPPAPPPGIPDIEPFWDSAHHWRDVGNTTAATPAKPTNKVISPRPGLGSHRPEHYDQIAANILLFQNKNGGWAKNYDMYATYDDAGKKQIRDNIDKAPTTFDNEATHTQVAYLAKVYTLSPKPGYRAAVERGLRFILSAQLESGGFPQNWPAPAAFHACITYNDRVMVGILTLLRDAGDRANGFSWLDDDLAARCRAAAARGLACILATQYTDKHGTLQAWGQQHDPQTLQPALGRKYELPSLCAQDTAEILAYLMTYENPVPEVSRSIRAAARWLQTVAIKNTRYEVIDSTEVTFGTHATTKDRRVLPDANAPDLWARMYELETNRPLFSGRSGAKYYTYAEVDRDRRTGYDWYGYWPAEILTKDYPAWLKKHALK